MNVELRSMLAELREETVHLSRRIRQKHLTVGSGTDPSLAPLLTAEPGQREVANSRPIPGTRPVREVATALITPPAGARLRDSTQVSMADLATSHPKRAGAHHLLLLVLLPSLVIVLAIAVSMQTDIHDFLSQLVPGLD